MKKITYLEYTSIKTYKRSLFLADGTPGYNNYLKPKEKTSGFSKKRYNLVNKYKNEIF